MKSLRVEIDWTEQNKRFVMSKSMIQIQTMTTPNPHSLKFCFNQQISEQTAEFNDPLQASKSPLAQKILNLPWVQGVFIGKDFVTINKEDWVEWKYVTEPIVEMLSHHIRNKEAVLLQSSSHCTPTSPLQEIDKQIVQVIEDHIQPYVKKDGGYIRFVKFEEGQVYIQMEGACSGCPSALWTLKEGVESLLKKEVPEVQKVVPV